MKYLKGLLEYFHVANVTQRMFKHVIMQSLRGTVTDWWELIQDNIQTINEFKTRFTDRYLRRQTQAKIRNELKFGFYEPPGNLSKSEYVIRLYNHQVQILSDTPNESDTGDTFLSHFDRDIQQAVFTQKSTPFEALLSLLVTQEHMGALNCSRGPVRYDYWREYIRSNYSAHNQSRLISFQDNRSNVRVSTPITYKGPDT